MLEVSHHTDELDSASGGQAGTPVSWRSAAAEGTPTLYVHGVPNSSLMWQPFLERTGGLALDLPGFGDAVKAATFPFSIAGYDGYIERFLDWRELDSVNLVMHDWGAAALAFAQRFPERVERVVLIDALPLADGYEWHRAARIWRTPVLGELAMGCLTPRLLRRALRSANAGPLPERDLRQIYETLDYGTQRAVLKLYRSVKPGTLAAAGAHLDRVDAPALIAWGELDPYIPARAAQQYAGELGGECEVVTLADAGHWPWLDRPDLIDAVADFLARS
ncbi:MAG: alpha/beta hydrolase [Solirubrobacteraceae bacterium]